MLEYDSNVVELIASTEKTLFPRKKNFFCTR